MSDKLHPNRKKTTIWNFFYLNLRTVIAIVNGILMVPLYLHYIPSGLFGAWLATGNIMTWLTIADPGVGDVLLQKIGNALGKNDKKEIGLSISSGLLISGLVFFLILLLGLIGSLYTSKIINYTAADAETLIVCFRIALIGTCFGLLANTFNNILLGFQKTKEFGFVNTLFLVSAIVLNVVLLVTGHGLYSIAWAFLYRGLGQLLFAVIYCYYVLNKHTIPYELDWKYTKSLSKIFAYTFGGKTFNALSGNIDLIIISRFVGPEAVTLLELSRRPIKIATGFVTNISISALPAFSHLSGTNEKERIRKTTVDGMIFIHWFCIFIIGGFMLFSQSLISHWAGANNYFGNINNVISCFAFYFFSLVISISNILYTMGDIKKNNIIQMTRTVFYLVIVVFFVKFMGIRGELIAFLLSILLIGGSYYPRRLVIMTGLRHMDVRSLVKELLFGLLLLAACALVSLVYKYDLNISYIFLFGTLYSILFFLYVSLVSDKLKALLNDRIPFIKSRKLIN